jgi:hypothetical protein
MSSLDGVKAGDKVLLFVRTGGQRERDQVPREVTIVKVGRTLVHIPQMEAHPDGKTHTYKIEGGYRNDGYGHSQLMTREAVADEKQRESLTERLRKHGFEYNWRSEKQPTAVLEAVLKLLDDAGAEG